jgi:hypothetical protein
MNSRSSLLPAPLLPLNSLLLLRTRSGCDADRALMKLNPKTARTLKSCAKRGPLIRLWSTADFHESPPCRRWAPMVLVWGRLGEVNMAVAATEQAPLPVLSLQAVSLVNTSSKKMKSRNCWVLAVVSQRLAARARSLPRTTLRLLTLLEILTLLMLPTYCQVPPKLTAVHPLMYPLQLPRISQALTCRLLQPLLLRQLSNSQDQEVRASPEGVPRRCLAFFLPCRLHQ